METTTNKLFYIITATGGGCQPKLLKINENITDVQITFRKRKQPDDQECQCSDEIKLLQNKLSRVTTLHGNLWVPIHKYSTK